MSEKPDGRYVIKGTSVSAGTVRIGLSRNVPGGTKPLGEAVLDVAAGSVKFVATQGVRFSLDDLRSLVTVCETLEVQVFSMLDHESDACPGEGG